MDATWKCIECEERWEEVLPPMWIDSEEEAWPQCPECGQPGWLIELLATA